MDTENESIAIAEAISNELEQQIESKVEDNDEVPVEATHAADNEENAEQTQVHETGAETKADAPATGTEQELQRRHRLTAVEKRAARKARLKQARNIRFTIGETHHDFDIVKKQGYALSSADTGLNDSLEASMNTAISTPTRLEPEVTDLEEIVLPVFMPEDDESFFIDDSDSDDDDEIVQTAIRGENSVQAKTDFLDNFEIPSLEDISEDDTDEILDRLKSQLSEQQSIASRLTLDPGKFVDPLTGDNLSTSVDSRESSESSREYTLDVSSSSTDLFGFKSLMTFTNDSTTDEEDILRQFETVFITPETLRFQPSVRSIHHHSDMQQVARDFLNDIITNVVTIAENIKLDGALNLKLDKLKLHKKLSEEVSQYNYEKHRNEYLNTKMIEYYRRMKNTRAITALPTKLHEREYERYMATLKRLDFNLDLLAEAKKKNAYLLTSVLIDLSYVANISIYSEHYLTKKILSTLGNKSDYITRVTERELRLMRQKRNEISDVRLFLITRTHALGRIKDKINKLQQIDERISMDDFILLQNQVAALNKKIEERNVELKKLRYQHHSDLHVSQHCREKTQSLNAKLKVRKYKLKRSLEAHQMLRQSLYHGKLERQRIRYHSCELAYQGGILAMPSLMYDYDETVDKVNAKQAIVNELKETVSRLSQRIADFESRNRKTILTN